jgi:hypothetical protein
MAKTNVTGCDDASFAPKGFSVKGAKFDQCRLHFAVASDSITSLKYTLFVTGCPPFGFSRRIRVT